jgi:hypothetical protein
LDANRGATEFISESNGGNIHFALLQGLGFGQLSFFV